MECLHPSAWVWGDDQRVRKLASERLGGFWLWMLSPASRQCRRWEMALMGPRPVPAPTAHTWTEFRPSPPSSSHSEYLGLEQADRTCSLSLSDSQINKRKTFFTRKKRMICKNNLWKDYKHFWYEHASNLAVGISLGMPHPCHSMWIRVPVRLQFQLPVHVHFWGPLNSMPSPSAWHSLSCSGHLRYQSANGRFHSTNVSPFLFPVLPSSLPHSLTVSAQTNKNKS